VSLISLSIVEEDDIDSVKAASVGSTAAAAS